jgi:hypothetical protein
MKSVLQRNEKENSKEEKSRRELIKKAETKKH